MPPKITILMPCYNGANYIAEAIDSVVAQSIVDWELLVSDDGSTDGTREYLQSISDQRIKVFLQPRNLGIFANLNFLFSRASGPITQILCQDDRFADSDALQLILGAWNSLPDSTVFLRCNHGTEEGSALVALERDWLPSIIEPRDSDLYFFLFGCIPGNLSNVSIRTHIVAEIGWFRTDLPYAGDFEFWSRVGREKQWAISKLRVVFVRSHSGQASGTLNMRGELLPQLRDVTKILFENLRRTGIAPVTLRLMSTSCYVLQHLDRGLKAGLLKNDWEYLHKVEKCFLTSGHFLGRRVTWLLYLASMRGKLFGPTIARYILSQYRRRVPIT